MNLWKYPKQHAATDELNGGGAGGPNNNQNQQQNNQQQQQNQNQQQQQQQQQNNQQQATWPDTWRQTLAAGDDKELKRLERFAAPTDVYRSYRALEQRISTGELKSATPFPENGTPEQQAAWRTEHGVPESPDKYKLADGIQVTEEVKPVVNELLKVAHAVHMPPAQASAVAQWYIDVRQQAIERRSEQDNQIAQQNTDALRSEWGNDYRTNLNAVHALLDQAPEGIKDAFLGGRLADGTPVGSNPGMLKFLANLSRQLNPAATLIPGSGNNPNAIEDEITTIEKTMRENRDAYNRDEKMQARYRDLLTAREQMKAK